MPLNLSLSLTKVLVVFAASKLKLPTQICFADANVRIVVANVHTAATADAIFEKSPVPQGVAVSAPEIAGAPEMRERDGGGGGGRGISAEVSEFNGRSGSSM